MLCTQKGSDVSLFSNDYAHTAISAFGYRGTSSIFGRHKTAGRLEMSGPFTDKTGGAYLIRAANIEEAKALAFTDPVHTTKSSVVTVYEWNAQ